MSSSGAHLAPPAPPPPKPAPPARPPGPPIEPCGACGNGGIIVDAGGGLRKRRACDCEIGRLHARLNFRLRLRDSLKDHIAERRSLAPFSADLFDTALAQSIDQAGRALRAAEARVVQPLTP